VTVYKYVRDCALRTRLNRVIRVLDAAVQDTRDEGKSNGK
jgi:hypothetical protein